MNRPKKKLPALQKVRSFSNSLRCLLDAFSVLRWGVAGSGLTPCFNDLLDADQCRLVSTGLAISELRPLPSAG